MIEGETETYETLAPPKPVVECDEALALHSSTPAALSPSRTEIGVTYDPVYFRCAYCLHHRTAVPHTDESLGHKFCTFNCLTSYHQESRRKSVEIIVKATDVPDGSSPRKEEVLLPPLDEWEEERLAHVYMKRKQIEGQRAEKPDVRPSDVLNLFKAITDSPLGNSLAQHMKSNTEHREKMNAKMAADMNKARNHGVAVSDSRLAQLAPLPVTHKRASIGSIEDARDIESVVKHEGTSRGNRMVRRASGPLLPSVRRESTGNLEDRSLGFVEGDVTASRPDGRRSSSHSENPVRGGRRLSEVDVSRTGGSSRRSSKANVAGRTTAPGPSAATLTRGSSNSNFTTVSTRRTSVSLYGQESRRTSISQYPRGDY